MNEIQLSREFSKEFAELQKRAENGEGEAEYLLKLVDKGIAKIINNHESGQKIQKKLWPEYYSQKYGVTNLWRLRLDNFWRLIYTVMSDRIKIVAIVLDVLNHRDYDKKFGYK